MRTVTYNAGAYLVEELLRAGVVGRFVEDGGDILLFDTHAGDRVSIHLIESSIALYEIRAILEGNEKARTHTLFILWGDRLLPGEGWQIAADDWLETLYSLYGDRVYAYDIFGSEIYIFPVYFEQDSRFAPARERHIRFGTTVHIGHLGCQTVSTPFGSWHVAGFGGTTGTLKRVASPLAAYYDLLGVDVDDDLEAVKKAYRLLARRHHPDLNRAADATARMQRINEAYDRIVAHLDPLR
jgi:hypothetical protein